MRDLNQEIRNVVGRGLGRGLGIGGVTNWPNQPAGAKNDLINARPKREKEIPVNKTEIATYVRI